VKDDDTDHRLKAMRHYRVSRAHEAHCCANCRWSDVGERGWYCFYANAIRDELVTRSGVCDRWTSELDQENA